MSPSFSPLSLNQLTRDLWGSFDASILAQIAPLADDPCYTMKFYKAPADEEELIAGNGHAEFGMKITPGSLIFGFYLPGNYPNGTPGTFTVQITDTNLEHKLFDAPLASLFLSNYNPTFQSNAGSFSVDQGSSPNFLTAPYPVVGDGLFFIEIQNTSDSEQRIQLVLGVLEVCG